MIIKGITKQYKTNYICINIKNYCTAHINLKKENDQMTYFILFL